MNPYSGHGWGRYLFKAQHGWELWMQRQEVGSMKQNRDPNVWIDRNGIEWKINKMTARHVDNALAYLRDNVERIRRERVAELRTVYLECSDPAVKAFVEMRASQVKMYSDEAVLEMLVQYPALLAEQKKRSLSTIRLGLVTEAMARAENHCILPTGTVRTTTLNDDGSVLVRFAW